MPEIAVKRILIIRLSAIGDVVFASPLVAACRQAHPNAEIDWLAEGVVRPLLQDMPGLHEVVLWPRQEWEELWREKRLIMLARAILKMRALLRERQYDLVVDAQGLVKSALLAWLTGARSRIGFKSKEPTGVFLTKRIEKSITPRISSEYLGLAEALSWSTRDFDLVLGISASDENRAQDVIGSVPYTVIAPFTTRAQKHWTDDRWRQLISDLLVQGHKVACLGGPGDREHARAMLDGLGVENWVGKFPLGVSAGIVGRARALVGVDTGLTHMGVATGVPTVALFGSTCPYLETGGDRVRIIYHALSCSPCARRPTCQGRFDCMTDIGTDEVMLALEAVTCVDADGHTPDSGKGVAIDV